MDIAKRMNDGAYDITLRGRFTFSDHAGFREVLDQISDPKIRKLTFHMEEVEFVDSAALGMLLLAHDEAKKCEKKITISGAMGQVRKMFDMARFDTMFTMM